MSSSASSIFRRPVAASDDGAVVVTGPRCCGDKDDDGRCGCSTSSTSEDHVKVEGPQTVMEDDSTTIGNTVRDKLMHFLEGRYHAAPPYAEERELEDRNTIKIVSPQNKRQMVGDFDICREYSYEEEEENDNEEAHPNKTIRTRLAPLIPADAASFLEHSLGLGGTAATTASFEEAAEEGKLHTYILGKTYHPIDDYNARRDDESSLFWFTYRCDFPEIKPYAIHSDAGWGCMLRSAQMLMGQVLRLHFKSRDWRSPQALSRQRQDPFLRSFLTWFADFPSTNESVYSLHNMVASGLANYDKLPGEWYGPGTACYVLSDLAEMHGRQGVAGQLGRKLFRVHVASHGTVYRDAVRKLITRDSQSRHDEERKRKEAERPPAAHPLDLAWEEELLVAVADVEWDTALLLLIPLRLGLKDFNEDYVEGLAHIFSLPQSVGVLGGRPRGARWFYGALSDGSKIFGLDPHTVQNAPHRRSAHVNGELSSVVDLSDEYLRSVHTTYPEVFSPLRMDPSIALGFYCRTEQDLEHVFSSLKAWKEEHPDSPELFTVADKSPDYAADVSSAMSDMMLSSTVGSLLDDIDDQELSDEDEYVML